MGITSTSYHKFTMILTSKKKMSLCCCGGIPSFSSTLSLILSTRSVGSMSISISLLLWRDPLLLLNPLLDPLNTVGGLDVDLDLLASQSLHLDQHLLSVPM